ALLLTYVPGDWNALHQDLYGEIAFPFQVTFFLSRPGVDFTGGEFVLVEQRPRAQSRAEVIVPELGSMLVFANRYRPVQGKSGIYRTVMRHGVSRIRSGRRFALGIIFHDAK
ncbi:MAG: 2OG-Fe(II) oxygenase, partial [Polyangiaceae bacterium]